jgi:signal transduction histidine kinase
MTRLFRLGFATRVTVILIFSLVAFQALVVMGFYIRRSSDTGAGFRLPLPDQVAAIAELVERAPQDEREAILRAVNGSLLHVRIDATDPAPPMATWRHMPFVEQILKTYLAALGGRDVTVLVQTPTGRLIERFSPQAVLTIITSLNTGEKLIIQTHGPFTLAIFGFPPGFWAGIMGFGVVVLAIVIIRREARPLRRLAHAADQLNLNEPQPIADYPRSAREIRAVIAAFNRMQERISNLIRSRMTMIGAFSHDVRTYATRLRLRAELIADETERARAIRDIEDMICLVNDALFAVQDRPNVSSGELVDAAELVAEEIAQHRDAGARASFTFTGPEGGALLLGNAVALRRLVHNLVQNAIHYGGEARASVGVRGGEVVIAIDDSGPGIPPEQRASVMQAFVRLETSRSRKTGGAGLGLAIASKIAEAHAGRLTIGDAAGGGARITVELPLFNTAGGNNNV